MKFKKQIALLTILAAINLPCTSFAAEEDKELSLIAAEQEKGEDEQLDEINPALTESITTKRTKETDKEIKERKKKLRQARKEKEKENEQKLKESTNKKDRQRRDEPVVIEPTTPARQPEVKPQPKPQPIVEPKTPAPQPTPQPIVESKTPAPQPTPQPIVEPKTPAPQPTPQPIVEPKTPAPQPKPQPIVEPKTPALQPPSLLEPPPTITPHTVETVALPNQKLVYANFTEVARAVHFTPLYMPRKSGYEITGLYAGHGIAEVRYGRRWEPTVSLTVRTHKRAEGEPLQDISGVKGVKWRVDTSTGTTIYIAKISDTQQVAAWAVGHFTFSAQAENLSYAGFHSLVADELVELSTHYYLDL